MADIIHIGIAAFKITARGLMILAYILRDFIKKYILIYDFLW